MDGHTAILATNMLCRCSFLYAIVPGSTSRDFLSSSPYTVHLSLPLALRTTHLREHRLQLAVTQIGLPSQLAPTVLLEVEILKCIQELVQLHENNG